MEAHTNLLNLSVPVSQIQNNFLPGSYNCAWFSLCCTPSSFLTLNLSFLQIHSTLARRYLVPFPRHGIFRGLTRAFMNFAASDHQDKSTGPGSRIFTRRSKISLLWFLKYRLTANEARMMGNTSLKWPF